MLYNGGVSANAVCIREEDGSLSAIALGGAVVPVRLHFGFAVSTRAFILCRGSCLMVSHQTQGQTSGNFIWRTINPEAEKH